MSGAIRSCAGGVVFFDDEVFLLMSDRGEWVMPKGVIRNCNRSNDVALWRVEDEAGIHAEIIGIAGNTCYDFYSEGRGSEISNRIQWFAMRAFDRSFHISYEQGFLNGNYYPELFLRLIDIDLVIKHLADRDTACYHFVFGQSN